MMQLASYIMISWLTHCLHNSNSKFIKSLIRSSLTKYQHSLLQLQLAIARSLQCLCKINVQLRMYSYMLLSATSVKICGKATQLYLVIVLYIQLAICVVIAVVLSQLATQQLQTIYMVISVCVNVILFFHLQFYLLHGNPALH